MNKIFFISSIVILAAGCAVGPKYKRPQTKDPNAYTQATLRSDSITNLKWWEVYQDTILQSLIYEALDSNLDLRIAAERVEESKAILGFNKANLLPFIDYSARGRASDFRVHSTEAGVTFPNNSLALLGNVSWEIDLWGRLRHANRAAYAQLLASEEDRKSLYISLVAQVAELYFRLRGLDDRFVITTRTYETRMEYLRIITLRFQQGEVSELDKLQAEQIAASSSAELFALERGILIVENAINILLGRPYYPIARGLANAEQLVPLDIPSGLPSQLLQRRPDIR